MIPRSIVEKAMSELVDGDLPEVQVPYIPQQTDEWCWAACIQMVVAVYQNQFPSQCQLANMAFGRADCCNNPTPAPCLQGNNNICQLLVALQFNCNSQPVPMTPVEIANETQAGRPIIYNILWGTGDQHTGVIADIRPSAGGHEVYFLDPDLSFFQQLGIAPYGWVDYAWVLNGYNFGGNWTTTWFDIEH